MIGEFSRSRGVPSAVGLPIAIGFAGCASAPVREWACRERDQAIAALQQVDFEF